MTRGTGNRRTTAKSKRKKTGGRDFLPGNNANPKGRPKKDFDLVTRCRELTPAIIERYAEMGADAESAADVMAGKVVIEYGWDKPRQRVEMTGKDGGPMETREVHQTREEMRRELEGLEAAGCGEPGEPPGDEE